MMISSSRLAVATVILCFVAQGFAAAATAPQKVRAQARDIFEHVIAYKTSEGLGQVPAMANYLAHHTKVKKLFYPGLPEHPQHELARRQMHGFGAVIAFELGSYDNAKKFLDRVKLCSLGESLGGVETLISHPESMTHASVPIETRTRLGISPGLVRISVGIEEIDDLLGDLERGFAAL